MSQPSKVTNGRVIFKKIPEGYPIPGETTVYVEEEFDLNVPLNGGLLVKLVALSVDPYLRGRMRPTNVELYSAPFFPDQAIDNFAVAVVLRSESSKAKAGDHIAGYFTFENYVILAADTPFEVLNNPHNLPWSIFVGAAGMPGKTAYFGWKFFAKAKKGETVYISTAAGPVGSVVAQIAKAEGLKVIGSTGSEAKVAFLRDELKIDIAFNYKTTDVHKVLKDAGGIDIYWDHVGGEQLESALDTAHNYARVINCGAIANYNGTHVPIRNIHELFQKRISMNGFMVLDHFGTPIDAEATEYLTAAIAKGEIKYREHKYTLKEAGQALLDVQKGDNQAKAVITFD